MKFLYANDEKLVPKCSAFNLGEGEWYRRHWDMSPLLDIKTLRKNVSLDQLSLQIKKKL